MCVFVFDSYNLNYNFLFLILFSSILFFFFSSYVRLYYTQQVLNKCQIWQTLTVFNSTQQFPTIAIDKPLQIILVVDIRIRFRQISAWIGMYPPCDGRNGPMKVYFYFIFFIKSMISLFKNSGTEYIQWQLNEVENFAHCFKRGVKFQTKCFQNSRFEPESKPWNRTPQSTS